MRYKKVRIFILFSTFDWLAAALSIAHLEEKKGHEAAVLDLTHLSWPHLGTHTLRQSKVKRQRDGSHSLTEKDLGAVESAVLAEAVSLVRADSDRVIVRILSQLKKVFLFRSIGSLRELVKDVDVIYVPNGRFALVRLIESLASSTTEFRYFEIGYEGERRYMVLPFPFHDRVRRQEAILASPVDLTKNLRTADEWLARRVVPNSDFNVFSSGWRSVAEEIPMAKRNVFFTSSTDEYWALGGSWLNPNWKSQYHAFGAVITRLKSLGESSFLLRLHPNMLNKSLDFVRSELKEIVALKRLHPELNIIWPHEAANSYSLVEAAERVFVSMSTIGLEASLMGKSVWLTSPSNYDEVADIRKIHSPEEVQTSTFATWDVRKEKAAKYVAYTHWESTVYQYQTSRLKFPMLLTIPMRKLATRVFFRLGSGRTPWTKRSVLRLLESTRHDL